MSLQPHGRIRRTLVVMVMLRRRSTAIINLCLWKFMRNMTGHV